ncbi:MAG: hypothetical protein ABIA47_01775 [bacterium]
MLVLILSSCLGCFGSPAPVQDTSPSCHTRCDSDETQILSDCEEDRQECAWDERCYDFDSGSYCMQCEIESYVCNKFDELWAEYDCGFYRYFRTCRGICEDGECVSCDSSYTYECYQGDIWQVDACGERELHTECESGACDSTSNECYPCDHSTRETCIGGELVEADLCDNVVEVIDDCEDEGSCADGACCDPSYYYACDYSSSLGRWTVVRCSDCHPDWAISSTCDLPEDGGTCCADAYPPYCCNY